MVAAILLFLVGLVLLIKGGDWFVDGATGIARRFHIPDLIIGATVVSIGTTLPEVMVSAESALSGHGEIAYGNALGSIICNTALIAALTIAVRPSKVDRSTLKLPVIFFFIAAIFYALNAYLVGEFTRISGIVLLLIFAVYICLYVKQTMASSQTVSVTSAGSASGSTTSSAGTIERTAGNEENSGDVAEASDTASKRGNSLVKEILLLIVGAVLIAIGADLLVDNGTIIAEGMGVPESVIALTFVALGTSLPELVTAITSLAKGHGALSLGNVIGANLFNLVLVCGISVTLAPFEVPCSKTIAGLNSSLVVDIPLVFFVMLFLTIPALKKGKLYRWQGVILLIVYAVFCVYQFIA